MKFNTSYALVILTVISLFSSFNISQYCNEFNNYFGDDFVKNMEEKNTMIENSNGITVFKDVECIFGQEVNPKCTVKKIEIDSNLDDNLKTDILENETKEILEIHSCYYKNHFTLGMFLNKIDVYFIEGNYKYDLSTDKNLNEDIKKDYSGSQRMRQYKEMIQSLKKLNKNDLIYSNLSPEKIVFKKEEKEGRNVLRLKNSIDYRKIGQDSLIEAPEQEKPLFRHIKSFGIEKNIYNFDIYSYVLTILKIENEELIPNWGIDPVEFKKKNNEEKISIFSEYLKKIKTDFYNKFIEGEKNDAIPEDMLKKWKEDNLKGKKIGNLFELALKYLQVDIEKKELDFDDLYQDLDGLLLQMRKRRIII